MAEKLYYHDINLLDVGQLIRARSQNVDNTNMAALAATLGADNKGLFVYNTETKKNYTWDGVAFVADAIDMVGDVIFKGVITDLTDPANVDPFIGHQYAIGTAGTLSITGVTFTPSAVVEVGDQVLFTSATEAYIFQRNDVEATETLLGNVRKATQSDVNSGTGQDVVTATTLQTKLVAQKFTKQYNASVNLAANTPFTVTHGLGLVDRDAFTINIMHGNSQISVDVDSSDVNSLTLTSLLPLTGVKVTVIGASTT
jgi:hypothetical protein